MAIVDIVHYNIEQSALKVELEIIQYNLNESAVVNCSFLDAIDKKISSILVYITDDDFATGWVNDDDLINICLRKLGLQRA